MLVDFVRASTFCINNIASKTVKTYAVVWTQKSAFVFEVLNSIARDLICFVFFSRNKISKSILPRIQKVTEKPCLFVQGLHQHENTLPLTNFFLDQM